MIQFNRDECTDLDKSLTREWLETNGIGGFASSTVAGANTRRYHGLLVAATKPPVGRFVLLSKLEEVIILDGRRYELSTNRYPGVVHPEGYRFLKEFRLDPFPVYVYRIADIEIEKSIFMVHGENTTAIQYEVHGAPSELALEVRPLIAFRDYHNTTHANDGLNPHVEAQSGRAIVAPYSGLPELHLAHDADRIETNGCWYHNFEYDVERERGLDYHEDLFNPLVLRFNLTGRSSAALIASTERREATALANLRRAEVKRRSEIRRSAMSHDQLAQDLVAAADQFIVKRGANQTIIAGYHWFADWGRDTMISLPGLTLVTGKTEVARGILLEFAAHLDQGMLPNRFPDAGEAPEYNTVDATLWFYEAVRAFLKYTGDFDFVRHSLYEALREAIRWHVRGTRYGIRVEDDGLLRAGEPGVQLTWMDAKVGDWVVTPRHGKPVEIQALWYNALRVMEQLAHRFDDGEGKGQCNELALLAKANFNRLFWNETDGCLYDFVDGHFRDGSIRPNQIFAASLAHTMLPAGRARQVVAVVERELLTPYGLRSLSPKDQQYRPRYEGDPVSRDGAYHQGTVWPWLMGPFITAYVEVNGRTQKARQQAAAMLASFREHLSEACLGQVCEVFDADPPHYPRGCAAQAWSVAELLRAAVEDVWEVEQVLRVRRRMEVACLGAR